MGKRLENLNGQKFGNWTVLSTEVKLYSKRLCSVCTCKCNCGKIKEVRATALISGKSNRCTSCANIVKKQHIIKVTQVNMDHIVV